MMMGMATKSLQLPEDKGVRFYRSTSCICMVKLHVFAHFFYFTRFFYLHEALSSTSLSPVKFMYLHMMGMAKKLARP